VLWLHALVLPKDDVAATRATAALLLAITPHAAAAHSCEPPRLSALQLPSLPCPLCSTQAALQAAGPQTIKLSLLHAVHYRAAGRCTASHRAALRAAGRRAIALRAALSAVAVATAV
jgi:hypothetical protein